VKANPGAHDVHYVALLVWQPYYKGKQSPLTANQSGQTYWIEPRDSVAPAFKIGGFATPFGFSLQFKQI